MLEITSQAILDRVMNGDVGEPVVSTSAVEQGTLGGAQSILTVPRGQVLLITSVQLQADPGKHCITTVYDPSPALSFYGIQLTDEAGSPQWTLGFAPFLRRLSNYHAGITPTALSAPPGNVAVWNPKYAIPVPGGFTCKIQTTLGDFGNHGAIHGVMVDEATASSLGYNVGGTVATSRHGVTSSRGTAAATTILTGRTGQSIRILDVHVRLQPATNTSNVLTLQQVDGQKIFQWINSNIVDFVEQSFSPDIYLKPGQGLQIQTTVADTCSVNIVYEFVDQSEVPANFFFAQLNPTKPGTGATAVPVGGGDARRASTAFTLYYPKSGTTKSVPGVGAQHLIRGAQVSIQKGGGRFVNNLQVTDMTLGTISHGTAGGIVQFTAVAQTQTNAQVIPMLFAGHHDQNLQMVDANLCVPCKKNDGQIWFDTLNLNSNGTLSPAPSALLAVATADADVATWSATVWGRTIPANLRASANRGV